MTKRNQQAPDPDLLARFWQNLVLAVRLLFDGRVAATAKLIPALVLAYILSPIDLIPEVFLPFGVVDDLGVLVLGLQMFILSSPREVVEEYRNKRKAGDLHEPDDDQGQPEDEPKVIEGSYSVREDED
jgi:uncharacterized membrane protein YkvA (DUF1232 family)